MSLSPASCAAATRASQRSLPSSQSNESVWRARRPGTSSGSVKRAKETRRLAGLVAEALRVAANRGPSELVANFHRTHKTPCGTPPGAEVVEDVESAAQICSVADGHTAGQLYRNMRFTVAPQHGWFQTKRQARRASSSPFR